MKHPLTILMIAVTALLGVSTAAGQAPQHKAPLAEGLVPLTSTSGVFNPPRARGVMKFSFDWPEPSAEFGGYTFGFRVQTFENAYAVDPARTGLERSPDHLRYVCEGFTWAGGQEKAPGGLVAEFTRSSAGVIEWEVSASMGQPVKSVTTVVRGVPRGELSLAGEAFFDPGDNEEIFEYPQLFGRLATPLVMIKTPEGGFFELAARQTEVRPARFFLQPGPESYRVELIYEQAGWDRRNSIRTNQWRIGPGESAEAIGRAHLLHVGEAYKIPLYNERADVPAWMREVKVVLALHAAHWTGYIFNDYARQLEILRWVATQIDAKEALVFLAGWDGRYYWNYPLYEPDPRMGGEAGFRRLIEEGHKLGFHFSAMFGTNSANRTLPVHQQYADAATRRIDGDAFDLNWVDWDNDRSNDGWMPFMNIAVPSWRNTLAEQISRVLDTFGIDSYFLDIAGAWQNNNKGDMFEGTRILVADLAKRHPGVLAIGEMHYDALEAFIPVSQVPRFELFPKMYDVYVESFNHLSHPAPGRGSTGVHEYGFNTYRPVKKGQRALPTISFSDDTFDNNRDLVSKDLAEARLWSASRKR